MGTRPVLVALWLFPARAGVIPAEEEEKERRWAFPRTRGGDPV